MIVSSGYNISGPEVEEALIVAAPTSSSARWSAAPDEARGQHRQGVRRADGTDSTPLPGRGRPDGPGQGDPGPRQAGDRAVQVPARHRVRRRPAAHLVGQGPALQAPPSSSARRRASRRCDRALDPDRAGGRVARHRRRRPLPPLQRHPLGRGRRVRAAPRPRAARAVRPRAAGPLQVDYLERLWFRDRVSIELRIAEVGRTSLLYDFEVCRGETPAARGRLVCVQSNPTGQGAQAWPDDVAAILRGESPPAPGGDRDVTRRDCSLGPRPPETSPTIAERGGSEGHEPSAVDVEHDAGDVGRLVGGEEEHGVDDLAQLREAAQRDRVRAPRRARPPASRRTSAAAAR